VRCSYRILVFLAEIESLGNGNRRGGPSHGRRGKGKAVGSLLCIFISLLPRRRRSEWGKKKELPEGGGGEGGGGNKKKTEKVALFCCVLLYFLVTSSSKKEGKSSREGGKRGEEKRSDNLTSLPSCFIFAQDGRKVCRPSYLRRKARRRGED